MGKPGAVNTPTAMWLEEQPLGFSVARLPGEYSMFTREIGDDVVFYNARLNFTSFLAANLSIAYRREKAQQNRLGIGDRQFDLRFRLLKEKEWLPAVVIGITPPGSAAPYLSHDYIVLTKNFQHSLGKFQVSAGYGSPYVFRRENESDSYFDVFVEKKSNFLDNNYLSGFFGSLVYKPVNWSGLMLEHDSHTFNAGLFITPLKWLSLQLTSYEFKEFSYSAAVNFKLDLLPQKLRNND